MCDECSKHPRRRVAHCTGSADTPPLSSEQSAALLALCLPVGHPERTADPAKLVRKADGTIDYGVPANMLLLVSMVYGVGPPGDRPPDDMDTGQPPQEAEGPHNDQSPPDDWEEALDHEPPPDEEEGCG